jgi:hypothetical protein
MTYERPNVERRRIVAKLSISQSMCYEKGGSWDDGVCYPPA